MTHEHLSSLPPEGKGFCAGLRRSALLFVFSKTYHVFIAADIIISTLVVIVHTSEYFKSYYDYYLDGMEFMVLSVFVTEIILKLFALGPEFFKDNWNILDFLVVVWDITEISLHFFTVILVAAHTSWIFRLLLVFKMLRTARFLQMIGTIKILMNTVFASIRTALAIGTLLLINTYTFAVIGRGVFGKSYTRYFNDYGSIVATMMQLLTFDEWLSIYNEVVGEESSYWSLILYIALYIVGSCFICMNLIIAVLVSNYVAAVRTVEEEVNLEQMGYVDDYNAFIHKFLKATRPLISASEKQPRLLAAKSGSSVAVRALDMMPSELDFSGAQMSPTIIHYYQILASIEFDSHIYHQVNYSMEMLFNLALNKQMRSPPV